MKGFVRLERKYGIKIEEEEFWNPFKGKYIKRYNMYSADSCSWAKGLTKDGIRKECEEWNDALLSIKEKMENLR